MKDNHIIFENQSVLDALKSLNAIKIDYMLLFVLNKKKQMVGTLSDGDVRRALISGHTLDEEVRNIISPNFKFIRFPDKNIVEGLRLQRAMNMHMVPLLDDDNQIVEIVDLDNYITKLPIDAVLMAGGKGERLRPLTDKTPKPLLKVGEKPIIDHNIDRLINYGISNINVTVNYLGEQLEDHFAKPHNGVQVKCVHEPKFLGTIGSVKYVDSFHNDVVLVMNSDLFTNINYEDFYLHFKKNKADMSAAAVPYTITVPYGIFDLDGRDIKGVLEKPVYNYFANAGIYLIKRDVIKEIPEGEFFDATDLMEKLIAENKKVVRFPITGFWLDIGSKEDYVKAQDLVKHID